MSRLPHQRAVITGASSGIGAGLAERLAARGVEVWLCARRQERLEALKARIIAGGGRAHAVPLDVSDTAATTETMARIDAESGGVDLVIANAGIGGKKAGAGLAAFDYADIDELMRINLLGAMATLTPFVKPMIARGRGHLVGISSIAADMPMPLGGPYGASKAALTFFLESADMELRPQGVDVTIVHPGFVRTELTEHADFPMPFMVELPEAVATIERAILARQRYLRFPRVLGAAADLARKLPRSARGVFGVFSR